ncbi:MAG: hypothetical protein GY696_32140 [Gammaproteobacteria bacterium]|nr:hypothetical protein [Gammaproteobacteria bacterium]
MTSTRTDTLSPSATPPWSTTSRPDLATTTPFSTLSSSSTSTKVDTPTSTALTTEETKKTRETATPFSGSPTSTALPIGGTESIRGTTGGTDAENKRRILIIGLCVGFGTLLLIILTIIIVLVMKRRRKASKKEGGLMEDGTMTKPKVMVQPWVAPKPETPRTAKTQSSSEQKTEKTQISSDLEETEKKKSVAIGGDVTAATSKTRTMGPAPNYLSETGSSDSLDFEATQVTETSTVEGSKGTNTSATQTSEFQANNAEKGTEMSASRLTVSKTGDLTRTVSAASNSKSDSSSRK